MCCNGGTRIDNRITQRACGVALCRINPHRIQTESGLFGVNALDLAVNLSGIDRQLFAHFDLTLAAHHAIHGDVIGVGRQIQCITNAHRLNQEAQFSGQFLADPFDAWHQLTTGFRVHQGNQTIPNFQTNQVHLVDVIPIQLFRRAAVSSLGWWCGRFDFINGLTADHHVADTGGQPSQREENHVWHARYQTQ